MSQSLRDSVELVAGVPLIVVIPALVDLMKRLGMPVRYAGLLAIGIATLLLALGDIALDGIAHDDWGVRLATWLLGGIVYGLAAAGFYSQREALISSRKDGPAAA